MDLMHIFYWLYPLACIPVVYFLSKEEPKPKFLAGILLAFVPWLINGIGLAFISAVITTLLLAGIIASAFYRQPHKKFLLNDLTEELIAFSNFFPKERKKRIEVERKAIELIKKNKGKPKKKYVLELLINAYGSQVVDRKRILKEIGSL